jgi:SWI/SNF-related matrix-associated actin-dependent regulator of chromatin subfamily A-like protein 1
MATTTELRNILGGLADIVLPHLQGEPVQINRGLAHLSSAQDAELDHRLAETLFPYQRAGVRFALAARRAMIGHGMGLGKTIQAIAAVTHERAYPCLVVCPPNLARNWVNEFAKWAPEVRVARLTGQTPGALPDADVWIIGDAVLSHWQDAIIAAGPAALVVDESQRMKNRAAKRTKAAIEISRKIPANGMVLLLTGTAVKANAGELLSQIQVLGLTDLFGGVGGFLNRYYPKVDRWSRESTNMVELFDVMSDSFYARLQFEDVAWQMGDRAPLGVIRVPVATELTGKAARDYTVARDDLRRFLVETRGERAADKALRAEALARLGVLRRLIGLAKVEGTVAHVRNLVEDGEQVIVFAWHRDVVDTIVDQLADAKIAAGKIYGGMDADKVETAKARFQAGQDPVIVLNIEAGSVGHTLTAAANVVFCEFAWSPADMTQAEARANRIGQIRKVVSHWMVGSNGAPTIDERLVDILNSKSLTTGQILDGKGELLLDDESVSAALLDWAENG